MEATVFYHSAKMRDITKCKLKPQRESVDDMIWPSVVLCCVQFPAFFSKMGFRENHKNCNRFCVNRMLCRFYSVGSQANKMIHFRHNVSFIFFSSKMPVSLSNQLMNLVVGIFSVHGFIYLLISSPFFKPLSLSVWRGVLLIKVK